MKNNVSQASNHKNNLMHSQSHSNVANYLGMANSRATKYQYSFKNPNVGQPHPSPS
jgi:hypothetical protein